MFGIYSMCEAFAGTMSNDTEVQQYSNAKMLSLFIALIIVYVIIALVGKFLWNNVVVDLISVAKPAKSIWQILGLAILMSLLMGR
jgi:hypothetical protein